MKRAPTPISGALCPGCGDMNSGVRDTRDHIYGRRRRRRCAVCNTTWSTIEVEMNFLLTLLSGLNVITGALAQLDGALGLKRLLANTRVTPPVRQQEALDLDAEDPPSIPHGSLASAPAFEVSDTHVSVWPASHMQPQPGMRVHAVDGRLIADVIDPGPVGGMELSFRQVPGTIADNVNVSFGNDFPVCTIPIVHKFIISPRPEAVEAGLAVAEALGPVPFPAHGKRRKS